MPNSNSNTEDRPHSPYSPSRLEGVANCDFYHPDDSAGSDYAEEGQLLHDRVPPDKPIDDLTAEQIEAVEFCRDVTRRTLGRRRTPGKYEVRIDLPNKQWGYVDFVSVSPNSKEVRILDYKFGFAVADANAYHSAQLQAYVLGIFESMPKIDWVVARLVKARLKQTERAFFTRDKHYAALRVRYDRLLKTAKDPKSKRVTSMCTYCVHNLRCPFVLDVVRSMEQPSAKVQPVGQLDERNLYSPSAAARVLEAIPVVTTWMRKYKEHMLSLAEDEIVAIPGFTVAKRRVHETVQGDLAEQIEQLDLVIAGQKVTADNAREAAKYTLGHTAKTIAGAMSNGDPKTEKSLRTVLERLFPAKTYNHLKKTS